MPVQSSLISVVPEIRVSKSGYISRYLHTWDSRVRDLKRGKSYFDHDRNTLVRSRLNNFCRTDNAKYADYFCFDRDRTTLLSTDNAPIVGGV